tara:strand:- start:542 stop:1057 length:516 start_codon:yes stop_codon:yes gene_type:complete
MTAASSGASAIYNRYSLENTYNNQMLAWSVQNKLDADPQLKYEAHITATSFENIVLLTGQAPTQAMRMQAEAITQSVPHTQKIINRIILTQPISTLQKLQDTWLTTKVDSQVITQGKLDPDDLKVVTENNTVYLIGSLKRAQANQVINMAKNTDGVQHVVTLIYYLEPKTA